MMTFELTVPVGSMRACRVCATLLLLLLAIETFNANIGEQNETIISNTTNICAMPRDAKMHCYCEPEQEINKTVKADCWVLNQNLKKTDLIWPRFVSQINIENLAFNVRANGVLSFVPSKVFEYLGSLKVFSIINSSIPKIQSHTFANLTSVQEISLKMNKIIHLSKRSFFNMPNITILTMDENNIVELVNDTFCELPALQKLYFTNNNISVIQDGAFRNLTNLIELKLDQNYISELKQECFYGLDNLKHLDLRRNNIRVLNSFTFVELWILETLLLDHNKIIELGARSFDGLSHLRNLSLSNNCLVTLVSRLLEGVRGLTVLNLSHNYLKRFTMEDLSPIYDNLKAENSYIYLDGNKIQCDCNISWMFKLRYQTKNIRLRKYLENFICELDIKFSKYFPALSSQITYTNKNEIGSDNIDEADTPLTDSKADICVTHEENDDLNDELKLRIIGKTSNYRTLLQFSNETMLPCPQEPVTDIIKVNHLENEANDSSKKMLSSSAQVRVCLVNFLLNFMILYSKT